MSVISEKCKTRLSAGYTLLELAVVIFIAGLLMAMAAGFAVPLLEKSKRLETEAKMAKISKALDFYAVRNYRIPCPAVPNRGTSNPPFGYERFSGTNGDQTPPNCGLSGNSNWFGIVPFNTIGLTENDIIDGWGNPIDYNISPAFGLDPNNANLTVHPLCRTRDWYYTDGDVTNNIMQHKAPRKARFCCPGNQYSAGTDLEVRDSGGASAILDIRNDSNIAPAGSVCATITGTCTGIECCTGYRTTDIPFSITANTAVPPTATVTTVAYILVSHGQNGLYAYNLNTGIRAGGTLPNNEEGGNSDTVRVFYDISPEDSGNTGYDDIVLWRTQDMILAENGDSCAVP